MLDIGLRVRFFITVFIVLSLTAASVSAIHYHFFKQERLRLMELNLLQNASLIANSDLSLSKKEFSNLGQEFVNEVIGDDKVNMIVAIYDLNGKILYRNDNAYVFELPGRIDTNFSTWEDVEHKEYFIKYLTQKDNDDNRIIKVGMILNQSLVRWKGLSQRILVFVGIMMVVVSLISFFLTYLLFKPVQVLAQQVNLMAEKIETGDFLELQSWFQALKNQTEKNDEFSSLLKSLDRLAKKITETQQMTQRWSALMAHELKTPMTLLRVSIDELVSEINGPTKALANVENELKKLEEIIMDFLDWASVENDSFRPEIHANNVPETIMKCSRFFEKTHKGIKIEVVDQMDSDFRVFSNVIHLEQLVNNILTNASKYGNGFIRIVCTNGKLTFQDNGPGLPQKVKENFGKPFNKFAQRNSAGHGLGLAWVSTIAKKYDWKINLDTNSGTKIEIIFPKT